MTLFVHKFGDAVSATGVKRFSPGTLSIITSIVNVGELIGSLCAGIVGSLYGRKGCLLAASFCVCLAVILQAAAANIGTLIAGRVILGMGVGIISNGVPLYLSEVPPTAIRGIVVGSWQLTLAIGQVIGACVDQGTKDIPSEASYLIPICLQLIVPIIFFSFIWAIPESPRFLVSQKKNEMARKALMKINQSDKDYDPTLQLKEYVKDAKLEMNGPQGGWIELFTDPIERRKLICTAGTLAAQQITGVQFIFSYATVFSEDLHIANPFLITIIIDIIEVVGVLAGFFVVERFNRKPLLLITTAIMIASMAIIGGLASGPEVVPLVPPESFGKAIIAFICVFVFFFNAAWYALL